MPKREPLCLKRVPDDPDHGYWFGVCMLPKDHDGDHGNISWAQTGDGSRAGARG